MKYIGIICFFWSVAFSQANQVDAKGLKQGVWRKNTQERAFRFMKEHSRMISLLAFLGIIMNQEQSKR